MIDCPQLKLLVCHVRKTCGSALLEALLPWVHPPRPGGKLPPDTPNQFLINIQQEQVAPLRAFFARHGVPEPRFWPMARGRLTHLNGQAVGPDSFDDPETQRWINRDFNLSWSETLNPDNEVVRKNLDIAAGAAV